MEDSYQGNDILDVRIFIHICRILLDRYSPGHTFWNNIYLEKVMPKIPQLDFMGKQDYDFIQNIYLTMKAFMPENRIVDLRAHWRDNKRALDLLERMDPKLHAQLIEDFKIRKAEIQEKNIKNRDPNEKDL